MEAIPVKTIPVNGIPVKIVPRGFGETRRRDWWWIEPMLVFAVFSAFLGYGTWAALQNAHFEYGPYLSPFYSPPSCRSRGRPRTRRRRASARSTTSRAAWSRQIRAALS